MKVPFIDLKLQYSLIKDEIKKAIDNILESQQFILGESVERFEGLIADYCGGRFAVGVASGSDAILLSLMALDVNANHEVITTPFTFFATAGSISRGGSKPVFVDIEPMTFNINPDLIEEKITRRTKAIIPVHLFGQMADMDPILEIAKERNLYVIEDAAQSIGARYKDKRAGNMGDTGCFSFFPSKNLGCYGDGGVIITSSEEIAKKLRLLRVHGSRSKYYHEYIGCNSRLDALQAAVLEVKLKYLDKWTEMRRENANRYKKLFKETGLVDNGFVVIPFEKEYNYHVYNQYVIKVKERDKLFSFLRENGVGVEIYYPLPIHLQKCYKFLGYKEGDFPEAEKASKEVIAIPIYPELTFEQQIYIVEKIYEFYKKI